MTNRQLPSDRAAAFPVRVYRLGHEPGDDLMASTTAEERVAMVAELTARMWELAGGTHATYSRQTIPVRLVPRR